MLKILHTGDIHLDSPFSKLDARRAEIRRGELRAAFSSMMRFAREHAVDLLLIAGDLFDNESVTRETVALLTREFSLFPGKIVISPGNHDCITPGGVWDKAAFPENVYIFREPTLTRLSLDELGTDVYGCAFVSPERTDSPLIGECVADPSRINLVCLHGDTASPLSHYGPLTKAEILGFGAEYAALGHIHNPGEIVTTGSRAFGYCGCLEGRGPDEIGLKGAVLVEIVKNADTASVRTRRIRFCRRHYELSEIDCTGADTLTAIEAAIEAEIARRGFGEDTLLRVTLTGAVAPSLVVDTRAIAARFSDLFDLTVRDRTTPQLTAAPNSTAAMIRCHGRRRGRSAAAVNPSGRNSAAFMIMVRMYSGCSAIRSKVAKGCKITTGSAIGSRRSSVTHAINKTLSGSSTRLASFHHNIRPFTAASSSHRLHSTQSTSNPSTTTSNGRE